MSPLIIGSPYATACKFQACSHPLFQLIKASSWYLRYSGNLLKSSWFLW